MLQEQKRALADAIITADNSLIRDLGREELSVAPSPGIPNAARKRRARPNDRPTFATRAKPEGQLIHQDS